MTTQHLEALRADFVLGMPPGWLRDCTKLPDVAAAAPAPEPRAAPPSVQREAGMPPGEIPAPTFPTMPLPPLLRTTHH
jgi:hypothetical protein